MFDAPKLKIKRAKHHITELDAAITAFIHTDFFRLSVQTDLAGRNVLKFEQTKSVPEDIPLMIGDAVHNLRAALDLLACEIVTVAGGTPSRYTNFPIRDTRQELQSTLNGADIKVAGADIMALILDVIQPYKGGKNNSIWALHGLDVIDKHRLLIPTFTVAALTNVNATVGPARFTNCTFSVGAGGVLNVMQFPGNPHLEGYGQPAFAILFDKGQSFEGEPVVPTLKQLAEIVSGVLKAIEEAYLARSKSGKSHAAP